MNHSFVVCDLKQGFADRLAGFVNKRHLCPYLMESFTDVGMLEEYGKKHRIEVLLIDELLYSKALEELNIGKVFLLTEEHVNQQDCEENRLYKYAPIPLIINAVMNDFADRNVNAMSTMTGKKAKVIGAFTPATNLGHSSYLLTLALKTAEKRKAFYLNISSTYGYRKMLKKESALDLSDAMYCIKNGNVGLKDWPEALVLNYGKLDYILPAAPVSDLQCMESTDWLSLLDAVRESDYEYIFLDLDESTAACFCMLEHCDIIYSAYRRDYLTENAFMAFDELLVNMGMSQISERIVKITPPDDDMTELTTDLFETLKLGKMGKYVSEIQHEDM